MRYPYVIVKEMGRKTRNERQNKPHGIKHKCLIQSQIIKPQITI